MIDRAKLELDPRADFALPLLLNLFTAIGVSMLARTVSTLAAQPILPFAGLWAFLVATEAFLSTTLMDVRAEDRPGALRVLEIVVMALIAKVIAAYAVMGAFVPAVVGGWDQLGTFAGLVLLGIAWWRGSQAAVMAGRLHPRLVVPTADQELVPTDEHGQAGQALQKSVLGQLFALALLIGIVSWAQGGSARWGWSAWAMLAEAILGVAAMLIAGQLRQQITWLMEGQQVPPGIFGTWAGQGVALLLLPVLAALLLPNLPRIPVEHLLPGQSRGGPVIPQPEQPQSQGDGGLFQELSRMNMAIGTDTHLRWVGPLIEILAAAGILLVVLLFLHAALRQLKERLGGKELRGFLAVLALLAGWYEALFQLLGGWLKNVLRQAIAVPAEAAAGVLSETGLLGRYLPRLRRAPSDPRSAVRYYFARLEGEAARRGVRRAGNQTAAEFAVQLESRAAEAQESIRRLTETYQIARYSNEPVQPEALSQVRRTWAQIVRAIGRRPR